jgi:hypothetical protein
MRMSLRETGWVDVEWTQMVQDSDRWRALVNALKNLRVLAPENFDRQTASLEIITLALQTAKKKRAVTRKQFSVNRTPLNKLLSEKTYQFHLQ